MLTRTVCLSSHGFGLLPELCGLTSGHIIEDIGALHRRSYQQLLVQRWGEGPGNPHSICDWGSTRPISCRLNAHNHGFFEPLFSALQIAFLSPSPYSLTLIFFLPLFLIVPQALEMNVSLYEQSTVLNLSTLRNQEFLPLPSFSGKRGISVQGRET